MKEVVGGRGLFYNQDIAITSAGHFVFNRSATITINIVMSQMHDKVAKNAKEMQKSHFMCASQNFLVNCTQQKIKANLSLN